MCAALGLTWGPERRVLEVLYWFINTGGSRDIQHQYRYLWLFCVCPGSPPESLNRYRFVCVIRVPVCARVSRVCPVCVPAPPGVFLLRPL